VVALGQRLHRCANHIATTVGAEHGERVRHGFQDKKAGGAAVRADPPMPATSTLRDQAHNALDRKLCAMQGLHHPGGSPAAFLTGLAHLSTLMPSQPRALHAGQGGVEGAGGQLPTQDWLLNLHILTAGGYQDTSEPPYHSIRWNVTPVSPFVPRLYIRWFHTPTLFSPVSAGMWRLPCMTVLFLAEA